ncbi:MAG: group 1 truncated hemoglobin [Deinococcota bacterium]
MGTSLTIYEALGGEATFHAAVNELYDRILSDARINHYFANTDMNVQRKHMASFMMMVFGGPNEYLGRTMHDAHQGLQLSEDDFQAVTEHLVGTLQHFEVPQATINGIVSAVASLTPEVVHAVHA